ncbi:alpha/beta fold hydrolase [Engelhardtia mirabilis]|uniref:alpha/beta fold hydrolase n=1 Tax=Engelhardtia mirabilis TaxID=2528011 RepID=UPI003AF3E234
MSWSHGGGGPTEVVFVHGNPGSIDDFVRVQELLPADRFRWVAFDRPGHGQSPRFDDSSVEAQLELLGRVIRSRGMSNPVLVGHSWGGGLALLYAREHPDQVAGIVLVGSEAAPDAKLQDWVPAAYTVPGVGWFISELLPLPLINPAVAAFDLCGAFAPASDVGYAGYSASRAAWRFARTSQIRAMVRDERAMFEALKAMWDEGLGPLPPAVVLYGGEDETVVPARHSQVLVPALGDRVREIVHAGEGHMQVVTQPLAVAESIRMVADRAQLGHWPDSDRYSTREVPAPRSESNPLTRYFGNRLDDTLDMFPSSVAVGPGLFVGARATAFAGIGLGGTSEADRYGMNALANPAGGARKPGASPLGGWEESSMGLGLLWGRAGESSYTWVGNAFVLVPIAYRARWASARDASSLTWSMVDFELVGLADKHALRPELTDVPYSPWDVEAELHLIGVGLRLGLAPIEVLDWIGGWFFLDLQGDDGD